MHVLRRPVETAGPYRPFPKTLLLGTCLESFDRYGHKLRSKPKWLLKGFAIQCRPPLAALNERSLKYLHGEY
jgi:hypothetical protein